MQSYIVIYKDTSIVSVASSTGKYDAYFNQIFNENGTNVSPEQILIGDEMIYNGRFILLPPTLSEIKPSSSMTMFRELPSWFTQLYPFVRELAPGERNKRTSIGLSILEAAFFFNNKKILEKIGEKLPQNSQQWVNYCLSLFDSKTFGEKDVYIRKYVNYVENFGKDVLEVYQEDFSKLACDLNIKLRFLSHPELTIQQFNDTGIIECNFLITPNKYFYLIYDNIQAELLQEGPYHSNFFESYLREKCPKKSYLALNESTIESVDRNNTWSIQILKNFAQKRMNALDIDTSIYEFINLLFSKNLDYQDLHQKIISLQCSDCNNFLHNLISLECGHKLCKECFIKFILKATNGLYVLNKLESQGKPPISCPINCGVKISNEILKNNIPDYQKWTKTAEDRINLTCGCGFQGKLCDFPLKCHHLCTECVFELLRTDSRRCTVCNYRMKSEKVIDFRLRKAFCECCRNEKLSVKCFCKSVCKHKICIECLSEVGTLCPIDLQPFEGITSEELRRLNLKKCEFCNSQYKKSCEFEILKECQCSVCTECQVVTSVTNCRKCEKLFSEGLNNWIKAESEEINRRNLNSRRMCMICQEIFPNDEIICLINCGHYFCKNCFNMNTEYLGSDISVIENLDKCPNCFGELSMYEIPHLLSQELQTKLTKFKIQKTDSFVDCPMCKESFVPSILRKVVCVNKDCRFVFCKNCGEPYHEGGNCQEVYILSRIKDLEGLNDPSGVSQCPRCRIPYIKDPSCDHVKCLDPNCQIEFCFSCSCIRSPTMEHGNHYHRPQCRFYGAYDGNDDKYREKCVMCKKLEKLCPKPKDLRVPRRVDADEVMG